MSTLKPDLSNIHLKDPAPESADVVEETRKLARHAQEYYQTLRTNESPLAATYRKNPYIVVAGAAGVGYLLAGGLFTPFTRRLARMSMKALIIPALAIQAKNLMSIPEEEP